MRSRPSIYEGDAETALLRLTLSKNVITDLTAIGARLGMTPSQYVRSLIHQHVTKLSKPAS